VRTTTIAAIATISVVGLAGCTAGPTGGGNSPSQAPAATKDVALVLGVNGSPFYQALACGAQAEAAKHGLNLKVSAPAQFAADAQIPVVNAVAAARPAVAVVVPTDAQALMPPIQALTGAGTQVITVDQTLADPSVVKSEIITDNAAGGKMAATELAKLLGDKGKVLVITQPPGSTAQDQRTQGFEEELKNHSGITYLGPQYQSDDPQKAAQIVTATLSAHPDLAGIFSTNDQGAIGALTGLQQAGASNRVKLVAYDAASAEVAALKNGTLAALIAQNPKQEGEVAMQTAAALIDGKPVQSKIVTELVTIGPGENAKADQYEYLGNC
jgi:ribose transport system substrate-binding protein